MHTSLATQAPDIASVAPALLISLRIFPTTLGELLEVFVLEPHTELEVCCTSLFSVSQAAAALEVQPVKTADSVSISRLGHETVDVTYNSLKWKWSWCCSRKTRKPRRS